MQAEKEIGLILDQLVGPGRDKDAKPVFNGWDEDSIRDAAKSRSGGGKTLVELAALNREELGALHARADEQAGVLAQLATAVSQLCLLYTSPSPRDRTRSRMPSSA